MKLSTKSQYGVRAMFDLALHSGEGPVSISHISEREEISVSYLEQLLNKLKRVGLVKSVRGAKGGYVLSMDARKIKIGDIVRSLEGDLSLVFCVDEDRARSCHRLDRCVTRLVWKRLSQSLDKTLDSITLEDLKRYPIKKK